MYVLSSDIGYEYVKIASDAGNRSFPSVVASATSRPKEVDYGFSQQKKLRNFEFLEIRDSDKDLGMWYVGDEASTKGNIQHSRQEDRYKSVQYDVLVAASLISTGAPDGEVQIVLDLPARTFDSETRRAVEDRYIGRHFCITDAHHKTHEFTIVDCLCLAQGVSSLWATLSPIQIYKGVHLIVDVGSRTTDYSLFAHGELDPEYTSGFNVGVFNVLDSVQQHIRHKYREDLPDRIVENALRSHLSLRVPFEIQRVGSKRETVVLDDILGQIVPNVGEQISEELLRRFELRMRDVDDIILCGGGAYLFESTLRQKFNNYQVWVAKDARWANANGSLLVGQEYFQL